MGAGKDPYGMRGRRRVIEDLMDRYRKLRDRGDIDEAIEQLRLASRLVNESMEHTLGVAGQILERIEQIYVEEKVAGGSYRRGSRRSDSLGGDG